MLARASRSSWWWTSTACTSSTWTPARASTTGASSTSSSAAGFPSGFLWGVATSAYQVEGAVHEDGRGPSIWDTFSHTPGRTSNGETGDVACDQYRRYEEDVALMAEMGIGAYRFSIAWPRVQPAGRGRVNTRGLDHYRRLVDTLNEHGVAPMPTLYHWDLPQALEDAGGWTDRDTASRFAEYADLVRSSLVGEVPHWITVNEPWVAAWIGYGTGRHAPGIADDAKAMLATHHLLLAHGLALEALEGEDVGIALNLQPTRPATDEEDDVRVAGLVHAHAAALYLDPLFGRGYPQELLERYGGVAEFVRDGDLEAIARPLGFLGVNYYRPEIVSASPSPARREYPGSLGAWSGPPEGAETTTMGWTIDPPALTELLVSLHDDYGHGRIMITENGAAFDDLVGSNGRVEDPRRVSYLREHVLAARDAIAAGVPLEGYLAWSLLDNFEWAEGYSKRFGLVHVDFETQVRTVKDSGRWYAEIARGGDPASA
ncbi:MAG: GH1 family beta-glucosidase [Actinomycetota bacterium]